MTIDTDKKTSNKYDRTTRGLRVECKYEIFKRRLLSAEHLQDRFLDDVNFYLAKYQFA